MLLHYVFSHYLFLALNHSLFFFLPHFLFFIYLKKIFFNLNLFILIGGEP